jgi:hypothetical protein
MTGLVTRLYLGRPQFRTDALASAANTPSTARRTSPSVLLNVDLRVVYSGGIGTAIVARGR